MKRPAKSAKIKTESAFVHESSYVDEGAQIHELLDRNPQWTAGLFEARGALDGP